MDSILIHPDLAERGKFVAHHLDTRAILQGGSPAEALANCREVVPEARARLREIARSSGTPLDPRRSSLESYETFDSVMERGRPTTLEARHEIWAVEGERIMGFDLLDYPGTMIRRCFYKPGDYLF